MGSPAVRRWQEVPLSDFVDARRAICYGIVQPGKPHTGGVPIVRVNNFANGHIHVDDALHVDPEIEQKYSRSRLEGGELLVTLVGSMGLSAIAPLELRGWNVARAVGVVPLREDADSRWINFVVRSRPAQDFIKAHANTTVQATFNLRDLACLPIPMPPDEVRVPACELLSALDDKIDLNRRMNETLEAMARAIFKDWFVDFGPTRAKAEGREPYLAREIWDLFPDALDDEGKPVGWERKPLDKVADFLNGLAMQKYPASEGEESLPVIKIAELRGGVSAKSNRASREVPEKYIVRGGDFLFSWSGSLLAKFWTEGDGALNQHLFKVTSNEYPQWFYSHWVYHHLDVFQSIAQSKATTMGHIQRRHLTEAMTVCPPMAVIGRLGDSISPLVDKAIANDLESRLLAQTRDLLLPKLMSGEIRLRDAEKAVEAVA
jgi:type I restriction enzyme S subunit